ncbi:MAG: hypothetical protein JJE53_01100 [Candidatus Pacebacteria bacterium]|nr:hypothetical protein [Candidatus Paceibacterota bacterium]
MEKIKGKLYVGYSYGIHNGDGNQWQLFTEMSYSKDRLDFTGRLSANKYSFLKEDIISIEPYIPLLPIYRKGVRIKHKIKSYHPCIIFTSSKETPDSLINKLKESGFLNGNIFKVDPVIENEVRRIQSSKLPTFLKVYILAIILFVIFYLIFDWNFLDEFL